MAFPFLRPKKFTKSKIWVNLLGISHPTQCPTCCKSHAACRTQDRRRWDAKILNAPMLPKAQNELPSNCALVSICKELAPKKLDLLNKSLFDLSYRVHPSIDICKFAFHWHFSIYHRRGLFSQVGLDVIQIVRSLSACQRDPGASNFFFIQVESEWRRPSEKHNLCQWRPEDFWNAT